MGLLGWIASKGRTVLAGRVGLPLSFFVRDGGVEVEIVEVVD